MAADRRSETSRANLGNHIPEALDPNGSAVVAVRLPPYLLHKVDTAFTNMTRSQAIRELLWQGLARIEEVGG